MPQVIIVNSLYELCMECITSKWKICKTLTSKPDEILVTINPDLRNNNILFNQLPSVLSEEIMKRLQYFGGPHEKTVFQQHITFSPKLQCLWLQPFYEDYLELFPHLGKLQVLDLSFTDAGDDCLKVIGTYCLNLKVLDVSSCHRVTDIGIQGLCVSQNHLEMGTEKIGICKSIYDLNLFSTGVTKNGISTLLKHLPDLKILSYHDRTLPFQVFMELVETASNQDLTCSNFSMMRFRISGLFLSSCRRDSLDLAMALCPSVVKVDIILEKGLTDIDLQCLKSLKRLRELKLCRPVGEDLEKMLITFEGCVAKLLEEIGNSLEHLELECFDVVNISTIVKFCPYLCFLSVNYYDRGSGDFTEAEKTRFRTEWNVEEKLTILKSLRYLRCGYYIPRDLLLWLLSLPSLVSISLVHCDSFTDNIIRAATKSNSFQNLEKFLFLRCDSFSNEGIDALMIDGSPLKRISLWHCKNVYVENVHDWHMLARRKNWKLDLDLFKIGKFVVYGKNDILGLRLRED